MKRLIALFLLFSTLVLNSTAVLADTPRLWYCVKNDVGLGIAHFSDYSHHYDEGFFGSVGLYIPNSVNSATLNISLELWWRTVYTTKTVAHDQDTVHIKDSGVSIEPNSAKTYCSGGPIG
jgi:hypothetical protein